MRRILSLQKILRLAALLVPVLWGANAVAQNFPTKPIRVLIGFPAGSSLDIVGRALAPHMQKELGQPIVIEIRTGAAGYVAFNATMNAEPDGHTVTFAWPVGLLPSLVKNNAIDARRDLTPISDALSSPYVFMTSATLPARTLPEFVAYAKSKPVNTLNFASSAVPLELMMYVVKNATGLTYTVVNYQGGPVIIPALINGEASMHINNFGPFSGQIEAGKIRVLFQTGHQKLAQLPDIPSATDVGVKDLQGIASDLGYWGPRGMSKAVADKIQRAIAYAVKQPDVLEMFRKQGYVAVGSTPEDQLRQYEASFKFWADAAKAANFVPQN